MHLRSIYIFACTPFNWQSGECGVMFAVIFINQKIIAASFQGNKVVFSSPLKLSDFSLFQQML